MDKKLWFLKQCPLFEQLSPSEIQQLEKRARMRTFQRRETIYSPVDAGASVMVLASGRVKIKDITPDGKETILAFIEEGEIFGELALLDDEPRQEFAEAAEISQVMVVLKENLLALMAQRPDLALSITKLVGLRRRRIENRLRNVLFLPSRDRLVRLILELMDSHGQRVGNLCPIQLRLSHQDLASLIGVTRETVTVVLGQLQAEQLIKAQRRCITVIDCHRLAEAKSLTDNGLPGLPLGQKSDM